MALRGVGCEINQIQDQALHSSCRRLGFGEISRQHFIEGGCVNQWHSAADASEQAARLRLSELRVGKARRS
jgi:hypothetical protein